MVRVGTIEFAPVNIPLARRAQTTAVFLWTAMPLLSVLLWIWTLFIMPPIALLYLGYCVVLQDFGRKGGIKSMWFRKLSFWKIYRDYFPVKLLRLYELPKDQTYIFGYHPHGIIGIGALVNFATEANGFEQLFPGINLRLLTLAVNFKIPFASLLIGLLGVCDASPESIKYILSRGPGNAVMLVLGGAKEALEARPGNATLVLKNRKGFVKLALQNGSWLVPVFSFGENDVYDQIENPDGSQLRQLQSKSQKIMGFSLPLVRGRGIFNYSFGLLPHRKPITSVVGKPIPVPKTASDQITAELVDEYHSKYLKGLEELFNAHKAEFGVPNAQLIFK
jgi:hypothetical protein